MGKKTLSENQDILEALETIPEVEFCERILLPLFVQLGFKKAELNHGNRERGRDLEPIRKPLPV